MPSPAITALINEFQTNKKALDDAQAAEREARRNYHASSTAVAKTLEADGADQIGKEFTWQTSERSAPELCQIVAVRCQPWAGAKLNPVVITKIAKGKQWGKTRIGLSRVVFNHDTREWIVS